MAKSYFLFGPFTFDAERTTLSRDGRRLDTGQRALGVLHALLKANGHTVTKAQLIDFAWPGAVVEESNLSVQIAALRKLLGPAPGGGDWIVTVARVGYRFAGPLTVADAAEQSTPEPTKNRASVAVLPFGNLSGEADNEYFVDGITEDIIAALSRFRWFFVIARNAAFAFKHRTPEEVAQALAVRYVLAGSVRKSGNRIRISAELVDARSAKTLWADRYDFELGELFSVQDRITEQVVGAIEPELLKSESALAIARRRGVHDMTGWDLVQQGTWFFHQVTRPTHLRARELFREARKAIRSSPRHTRGSAASARGSRRTAGARMKLQIFAKASTRHCKRCSSTRRIRTRTMRSRSPACLRANSIRRFEPRRKQSNSAPALHSVTWCWEWRASIPATHYARSALSSAAFSSIRTTRRISFGTTYSRRRCFSSASLTAPCSRRRTHSRCVPTGGLP